MALTTPATATRPMLAPILVPCPNPTCGKVHRIKQQYAGMRGRCPTCSSWMYVPRQAVRRTPSGEAKPSAAKPTATQPTTAAAPSGARMKTRFGKASALFLIVGVLALAVAAATPLLRGPEMRASGELAQVLSPLAPQAIAADRVVYVVAVPLGLSLLPLGALLSGWASRRSTVVAKLLSYAAVLGATALAFAAVHHLHTQQKLLDALRTTLEVSSAGGLSGEVVLEMGPALYVAVGALVTAAFAFWLSAFALHRRWWARVATLVLFGLPLTAGMLWIYRVEGSLDAIMQMFLGR